MVNPIFHSVSTQARDILKQMATDILQRMICAFFSHCEESEFRFSKESYFCLDQIFFITDSLALPFSQNIVYNIAVSYLSTLLVYQ